MLILKTNRARLVRTLLAVAFVLPVSTCTWSADTQTALTDLAVQTVGSATGLIVGELFNRQATTGHNVDPSVSISRQRH